MHYRNVNKRLSTFSQTVAQKLTQAFRIFSLATVLVSRHSHFMTRLFLKSIKPSSKKLTALNPNRIRDHLANERTYLAWMRSAIALLGFGVVIVRLRILHTDLPKIPGNGWQLGLLFSLSGLLTILLSAPHYFSVRDKIEADTYQPPDFWVVGFSSIVLLLGIVVIYYVFAIPELSSQFLIE